MGRNARRGKDTGSKPRRSIGPNGATHESRDDVFNDMTGDVGQAVVTAVVAVGELFVIEPEHVEDGGVEVVDVDLILSDADAAVVGGAVDGATFDAGAGHP